MLQFAWSSSFLIEVKWIDEKPNRADESEFDERQFERFLPQLVQIEVGNISFIWNENAVMNSAKSFLLFLEIEYNLNKNYQLKICHQRICCLFARFNL